MSASYRRVSSSAESEGDGNSSTIRRNERRSLSERLTDKFFALVWIFLAVVVAYTSDFFNVLLAFPKANRGLLQLAAVCVGINTILFLYLTIYLPYVKGLTDSSAWDVYCPRIIPTVTALSVLCGILLIRATWPVWGFLAPLVLGVEALGCLFALHFVPWPFG